MFYKIIAFTPQKRKERINLIFENGKVLGISIFLLDKFNLQQGTVLDENKLMVIIKEDLFQRGKNKALRFLSFRPRSIYELENKLREYFFKIFTTEKKNKESLLKVFLGRINQNFSTKTIEKIIKWLKKEKLADDFAFAQWWIEQRKQFKSASKRQIFWELKKKGIDSLLINEAFSSLEFSELENAKKLIRKKKNLGKFTNPEAKEKLWRWLLAKGFPPAVIKQAIDEEVKFE
jgi:regulatory protein